MGDEGIYGGGEVGASGARGMCACRPHHGRSNDMCLEEFGLHLRELEVIEICARWGVFRLGRSAYVRGFCLDKKNKRLEEFRLHLRELEVIEICARWGVFPM